MEIRGGKRGVNALGECRRIGVVAGALRFIFGSKGKLEFGVFEGIVRP
jgi:hypothetical protein